MHSKSTSSTCTLAVFLFVTMVTISLATPVRIKYDQRQDGDYNFATHVKTLTVMVPSDIKTDFDLSNFDFEDLKSLSQKKPGASQLGQGLNQQDGNNMKLVSSTNLVKTEESPYANNS
ncbi:hypothetical protein WDU94_006112 [Cyamophila willieti]